MQPTQHPSNNAVLLPPAGATNDECRPLPITRVQLSIGSSGVVSYWQPSAAELRLLAQGRPVYMLCAGTTHPPVRLGVDGDDRL